MYLIRPDQEHWGARNAVIASRWRKLPGVRCTVCGVWATTGLIYPLAGPDELRGADIPSSCDPVLPNEFRVLAETLRAHLLTGSRCLILPGTELGPLHGRAGGRLGSFAWVNPWTPLITEESLGALNRTGVSLSHSRAEIMVPPGLGCLVELEALPTAHLTEDRHASPCPVCGRLSVNPTVRARLDPRALDPSIPLQRVAECPTVLIASDAFAAASLELRLSDVVFSALSELLALD